MVLESGKREREEKRARKVAEGRPPREAFAELVRTMPTARKLAKLTELTEPVPADVYLAPEQD